MPNNQAGNGARRIVFWQAAQQALKDLHGQILRGGKVVTAVLEVSENAGGVLIKERGGVYILLGFPGARRVGVLHAVQCSPGKAKNSSGDFSLSVNSLRDENYYKMECRL